MASKQWRSQKITVGRRSSFIGNRSRRAAPLAARRPRHSLNHAKLAVRAPPLEPHGSPPTLPTVRATLTNIAEHQ
ncbi:hypothetical protein [uncultured Corynebacterium sp.]|uniref:hypothetical protein n=1 Tax=uncultured Corynebacterium sp. TaxID=159447 RepID=UPI0028D23203|nr:hypothetical protein [uncultured Corynebacterium sp.]